MYSFSEEMFMLDFFTFDAVVGRFCNRQEIINCLAKAYYVNDERVNQLFAIVTSKKVRNIVSLKDYKRYCRLRQYAETCKLEFSTTVAEDEILTIKGKALYIANDCGLIDVGNSTKASVYSNIVDKANAGQVVALRLYGVLQCAGIFFKKNIYGGVNNLVSAARWNSIESILALLKYDIVNRGLYIDMLFTLTTGTPYEEITIKAQNSYGIKIPKKIMECVLLSKVFGRGQVNPNIYLPVYANLLYSEIISFKDKEKILLLESKESVASYIDLPLKLSMQKFSYDVTAISELPIKRAEEQNAIIQNALNSDIRQFDVFKPLCLCSDSRYMRDYYRTAISKLYIDAHVETISIGDLNPCDFEPNMDNVFIRNCIEDMANVFIIYLVGDIKEAIIKVVCNFLQSAKRGKMRLMRPSIEIDLRMVLPICFCDKNNAQMLARYCEKIEIAAPNQEEQALFIRELISVKEGQYGITGLNIKDGVMNKLLSMSIDEAETVLDLAIAANRNGNQQLTLTVENASKFFKKREITRGFGYGGYKDVN